MIRVDGAAQRRAGATAKAYPEGLATLGTRRKLAMQLAPFIASFHHPREGQGYGGIFSRAENPSSSLRVIAIV